MFCPNCGFGLAPENNFCPNCGCPVEKAAPEAPARPGYNGVPYPTKAPAQPVGRPGYNGVPYPTKDQVYPLYQPAVPAPPAKPEKSPEAKAMRRAYNLGTLWSAVIFLVQSTVVSVVLFVALMLMIIPLVAGFSYSSGIFDTVQRVLEAISDPRFSTVVGIIYAAAYAGGLGLGFLISKTIRKRVEAKAPERQPLAAGQFVFIALVAFGLWGVGVIIGNWTELLLPIPNGAGFMNSIPMLIVAMIGAPIFEELIFRKFLIDRLLPFGEKAAVIFTALLFGMAHMNAGQFFLAFLLGLLFALVYIRTGKIIYTMALHFMINTTASLDAIGCMIFGDVFDTIWLILVLALAAAGVAACFAARKLDYFRLAPNREPEANWAAFRGWGFILVKILTVVSVIGMGLVSVLTGIPEYGAAALLHLLPAALAVVAIFLIPAKALKKCEPLPTEEAEDIPEAEKSEE